MARIGRFDMSGLKEFQRKLEKIDQEAIDGFLEDCAKELAARLLRKVVKRTPVGDYSGENYECKASEGDKREHQGNKQKGKKGGTLRRGWTNGQGYSKDYANSLPVRHEGDKFIIEIVNPVEYASYVEFGHRTNKKDGYGWAAGHFMMTISEKELKDMAPKILENKLKKFLGGVLQ